MTNEEMLAQLKKDVRAKVEELNFANYQGDLSGLVVICINKNGEVQIMQAFNNIQAPHIYVASGLLQRQIENMIQKNSTELKPRN